MSRLDTIRPGARRAGQLALGVAVSALFLWLAVRQIDFAEVAAALRRANFWWLAPAVVTLAFDLAVRGARWGVLLRPVAAVPWRRLAPILLIGYMGNALLPARLGELLRATLLGRRGLLPQGGTSAALGSVATERVLDGLTTVAILATVSWFVPRPDWLAPGLAAVSALFIGLLVVLALAVVFRVWLLGLLERFFGRYRWAGRPIRWAGQFLAGLSALRRPDLLVRAVGLSLLAWLLSALEYYWVFKAFNLPLGLSGAFFAVAAVSLSTIVPSAPGYVGTFEFAGVVVLGALGIDRAAAFSCTVVLHLVLQVPLVLGGLVSLWREGMRNEG